VVSADPAAARHSAARSEYSADWEIIIFALLDQAHHE
jgi:hypothetical protein